MDKLFLNNQSGNRGIGMSSDTSVGRVIDVFLSENDRERFKNDNIPSGSMGVIKCQIASAIKSSVESDSYIIAYPSNFFIKYYPLKGELVDLVEGPTVSAVNFSGNVTKKYYYRDIYSVWDSPEHNIIPFSGSTPVIKERGNIKSLQHLSGDFIIEGRYGNGIRLGAGNVFNNTPGMDPLVVIYNGQNSSDTSWNSHVENLDKDGSFIVLSNNQSINFTLGSYNFDSYGKKVTPVEKNNIVKAKETIPVSSPSKSIVEEDFIPTKIQEPEQKEVVTPLSGSVKPQMSAAEEEIIFLPDSENDFQFVQEQEDVEARHIEDPVFYERLVSSPELDVLTISINPTDLNKNLFPGIIAYLIHQQGYGGTRAIYRYSKLGYSKVPTPNEFVKSKKTDVNANMFGKFCPEGKAKGFKYANVSDDFVKTFGRNFTPTNFLLYWSNRYKNYIKQGYGTRPTKFDSIFIPLAAKNGVPIDIVRIVAQIESGMNPNSGNATYKGLFAIDMETFRRTYPNSSDIKNPEKNSVVGIRLLGESYRQAIKILNS